MSSISEKRQIRVLVVDDSPTVCDVVTRLLSSDEDIVVVDTATDGKAAVDKVKRLHPDIVTMDIEMPGMNGFDAIEHIMAFNPVPIVVLTASMWGRGQGYAYQALELGAVAVLPKPRNLMDLNQKFVDEVKILSRASVITHVRGKLKTNRHARATVQPRRSSDNRAVGIVCSTGGPNALRSVLGGLPADIPAGIVVVQHISEGFDKELTHWLSELCAIEVTEVGHGELIRPGVAYICPAGRHTVIRENETLALDDSPPLECFRPSGDLMLSSMSRVYGTNTVGVILTGMGRDGAMGMKSIRDARGRTIAQDEQTSLIFGMPRAAIELGVIDRIEPLGLISDAIMESLCTSWV
jgi:two-component system chemotaxis response regulator CheB